MAKYVLKHRGGDPPREDIALIERTEGVTIHDRTAGAMLVDVPEEAVRGLHERLPNWVVTPETTFAPPDPVRRRAQE
jgi:hypothetical protein